MQEVGLLGYSAKGNQSWVWPTPRIEVKRMKLKIKCRIITASQNVSLMNHFHAPILRSKRRVVKNQRVILIHFAI